eukprot:1469181-Prymnesium_polylepis.1
MNSKRFSVQSSVRIRYNKEVMYSTGSDEWNARGPSSKQGFQPRRRSGALANKKEAFKMPDGDGPFCGAQNLS